MNEPEVARIAAVGSPFVNHLRKRLLGTNVDEIPVYFQC
jgi:hypothetical protein